MFCPCTQPAIKKNTPPPPLPPSLPTQKKKTENIPKNKNIAGDRYPKRKHKKKTSGSLLNGSALMTSSDFKVTSINLSREMFHL
jgi:hypothetical protein